MKTEVQTRCDWSRLELNCGVDPMTDGTRRLQRMLVLCCTCLSACNSMGTLGPAQGTGTAALRPGAATRHAPGDTHTAPAHSGLPAPAKSAAQSAPPLPNGIVPGKMSRLAIPGYRPATVVHGRPGATRALVYLHGVCGDIEKIVAWGLAASERVTTIAIPGDRPCDGSPRFRWSQDLGLIHHLVQRALLATQRARGGQLITDQVVLFGYSQGSIRAEKLGEKYPRHYPWLILGGLPRDPVGERLAAARGVVVLMGSREPSSAAIARATTTLTELGLPMHFSLFPGAVHGQFGPQASPVITRSLSWLLAR